MANAALQIGELSKRTQCSIETIRYYERQGLLTRPRRSIGNFRLYSDAQIEDLEFILTCRALDMSLHDIRSLLRVRSTTEAPCGEVNDLLEVQIRQIRERLKVLRRLDKTLKALQQSCRANVQAKDCGILGGLKRLRCSTRK